MNVTVIEPSRAADPVSMATAYPQIIPRGNVVDLAVGIVIGAAFGDRDRPGPGEQVIAFQVNNTQI